MNIYLKFQQQRYAMIGDEVEIGTKFLLRVRDRYYWIVNETTQRFRNIYRVPKLFDQPSGSAKWKNIRGN